jgi:uncharacterized protein YdhG (YjbR/CyaY superfamily)
MQVKANNVDEYIAAQPAEAQPHLRQLRAWIQELVPDAAESISYGLPTYKLKKPVIYFGAAKKHSAVYGGNVGALGDEIEQFDHAKGTVRFALDKPLPEDFLRRLIVASAERSRG